MSFFRNLTLYHYLPCRQLLLATIPILAISLVALVIANMFPTSGLIGGAISFIFVTVYICSFVTGKVVSSYDILVLR